MGFHETAVYPINLSYGSTFGPGFNSAIIEGQSGRAQRIPRLEQPLYGGDLATGIRGLDEMATFRTFYIARQGAAYGFRFPDPLDNTSAADGVSAAAATDQDIGQGDGVTRAFQLRKQYTDALVTRNRNIEKPVIASVTTEVNSVTETDFVLDSTTGIITFGVGSIPAAGHTITAGFDFHVPVRFTKDVDEGLRVNLNDFDAGTLPAIGVIEDRNADSFEDEFFYGGSVEYAPTAGVNVALSLAGGRVVSLAPADGNSIAFLPDHTNLPGGGPYFYIRNSSAFSIAIQDYNGVAQMTLLAGDQVTVLYMDEGSIGWKFF